MATKLTAVEMRHVLSDDAAAYLLGVSTRTLAYRKRSGELDDVLSPGFRSVDVGLLGQKRGRTIPLSEILEAQAAVYREQAQAALSKLLKVELQMTRATKRELEAA